MASAKLLLASASPRRRDLLARIGVVPDQIIGADIDETPLKNEKPEAHALRLAISKAEALREAYPAHFILAADTVVAVGRKILPKAEDRVTAEACIKALSGRRHRTLGGICLIHPDGRKLTRIVETVVQFKRLTRTEINTYLDSGEWDGKAGGYAIQGYAESFIKFLSGSHSNVVGLSLYDTMNMLKGFGFFEPNACER